MNHIKLVKVAQDRDLISGGPFESARSRRSIAHGIIKDWREEVQDAKLEDYFFYNDSSNITECKLCPYSKDRNRTRGCKSIMLEHIRNVHLK